MRSKSKKNTLVPALALITLICLVFSVVATVRYTGLNSKLSETKKLLEEYKETADENSKAISALEQSALDKDKTINELEEKITEKDDKIKELEEKITKIQQAKAEGNTSAYKLTYGSNVYLTFDDGPSTKTTLQILDILKKYDIKATFFVVGRMVKSNPEVLKRIYAEGHEIAIHTYSHEYKQIYKSEEAFWEDFNKVEQLVKDTLGIQPTKFRFAGGSSTGYLKRELFDKIKVGLAERGYTYVDWNVSNEDSTAALVAEDKIVQAALSYSVGRKNLIVLCHDTNAKTTTPPALERIIQEYNKFGVTYKTLSEGDYVSQFRK